MARALRERDGVPIGHVFRALSGLYFRGKYTYAKRFASPVENEEWLSAGALVITQSRGLLSIESRVCLEHLEEFREVPIDPREPRFRRPFARDAELLREAIGPEGEVVLLGSIATPKYVEPLLETFGARLLFPREFVGRGDMSRGALLLRAAEAGTELPYVPVLGAVRHGARPPKLGTDRSRGEITVRPATSADIAAMSRVRISVRENALSDPARITREMYEDHLDRLGRTWVAVRRGSILGFASGARDGSIWALFVDPKSEGQGIARALMPPMVEWLFSLGHDRLRLGTEAGTRADRFYGAQGWVRGEMLDEWEVGYTLTRSAWTARRDVLAE